MPRPCGTSKFPPHVCKRACIASIVHRESQRMASLAAIVRYLQKYLRIDQIGDWDNALNGLQIENSGRATKVGAAVDASTGTLAQAAKRKIDFLLVHHGLFWTGLQPVTGPLCRQLRIAFDNNIALYAAHLPLDLHQQVGNNALLAKAL